MSFNSSCLLECLFDLYQFIKMSHQNSVLAIFVGNFCQCLSHVSGYSGGSIQDSALLYLYGDFFLLLLHDSPHYP